MEPTINKISSSGVRKGLSSYWKNTKSTKATMKAKHGCSNKVDSSSKYCECEPKASEEDTATGFISGNRSFRRKQLENASTHEKGIERPSYASSLHRLQKLHLIEPSMVMEQEGLGAVLLNVCTDVFQKQRMALLMRGDI